MSFFKGFADELRKLALDMGGGSERPTVEGEEQTDATPLLHERHIPDDVTRQTDRMDFFHDLLGGENKIKSGKVTAGKLGRHGTRR